MRFLLLGTLVLSSLFLFYETVFGDLPPAEFGFPFDDMKLSGANYFYFLFEKVNVVILAVVILLLKRSLITKVFLGICLVDLLDYVLFYGNLKFGIITWNVVKIGIMGLAIAYEKWK